MQACFGHQAKQLPGQPKFPARGARPDCGIAADDVASDLGLLHLFEILQGQLPRPFALQGTDHLTVAHHVRRQPSRRNGIEHSEGNLPGTVAGDADRGAVTKQIRLKLGCRHVMETPGLGLELLGGGGGGESVKLNYFVSM